MEKNKNLNILVFRSIRPEEMGYVLHDIHEKYELSNISVLTNKQNFYAMQNTQYVNKVITYSGNNFEYYSNLKDEINMISKNKYDLIVIPTNGNIETYQNIYKFVKNFFKFDSIKYYVYPKNFLPHPKINLLQILKYLLKTVVDILSFPIVLIVLLLFFIISIFKK